MAFGFCLRKKREEGKIREMTAEKQTIKVKVRVRHVPSPRAGPFAEAAAFGRKLVAEGKMTVAEAQRLSNRAYRETMIAQLNGWPVVGDPEELPEHQVLFCGSKRHSEP